MFRVIFGILIIVAFVFYLVWRKKAAPVLSAEEQLKELATKRQALEVRERVAAEEAALSELESKLKEEESKNGK